MLAVELYTLWCRYNAVKSFKILTTDTQCPAREGEIWGVFCEFEARSMFCLIRYQCHLEKGETMSMENISTKYLVLKKLDVFESKLISEEK